MPPQIDHWCLAPQANQRYSDSKLLTLPMPGDTLKDALQEATKGKGGALSAVAGALGPLGVGFFVYFAARRRIARL